MQEKADRIVLAHQKQGGNNMKSRSKEFPLKLLPNF